MNAIRADHGVRVRARSVCKCECDLPRILLQPHEFLVEMDDVLGHDRCKGVVQVRAMHAQIGRAEKVSGMGNSLMTSPVSHFRFRCE